MTYEEFEWQILQMVYEQGVDRLQPSFLAYTLGLPHETVTEHLETAVQAGLIELDVSAQGRLEYFIPGVDRDTLPKPVWKHDEPAPTQPAQPEPASDHYADFPIQRVSDQQPDRARHEGADGGVMTTGGGADGHVVGKPRRALVRKGHPSKNGLPPHLQSHAKGGQGRDDTDGSLRRMVMATGATADRQAVLEREATIDGGAPSPAGAMVPYREEANALLRVESNEDAFCDPSQTIFMRQIRVHGVQNEHALREQVQRLFESFGYKTLTTGHERLRFERGSVTFILALVPLFVLIVPLFVYLFLYCMGRSTIQQEPLELDVQIRSSGTGDSSYDIDLTFIGLHGVVLGAADQRVLNQEIDTLRDELRWALAGA